MKTYELEATEDTVIETLTKDPISRNKDLFRFMDILNSIDFGCSLALDGEWGSGKTFFVKQAEKIFEAVNPLNGNDKLSAIRDIWRIHEDRTGNELESTLAVYYDAWLNDNDVDSVLSIVYEIIKQLGNNYEIKSELNKIETLGMVGSDIVNHFMGVDVKKYFDESKSVDYLDDIKKDKDILKKVSIFFDDILAERGNRLVVFIDELDRCKPDYAVRLLERIKHYFSNERVTYVFAVNSTQLQYTIKKYYGEGFDAVRYLDRFFDLRISMPKVDSEKYFNLIGFPNTSYIIDDVCRNVIAKYKFSMRETERYIRIVKMAVYNAIHNGKISGAGFSEEKGYAFIATYIAPILIGTRIADLDRYKLFIGGEDSSLLLNIVEEKVGRSFEQYMLGRNETFDKDEKEKTLVHIGEKLQKIYDAIFVETYRDGKYEEYIGDMSFSKESKGRLLDIINLFSNITVLED